MWAGIESWLGSRVCWPPSPDRGGPARRGPVKGAADELILGRRAVVYGGGRDGDLRAHGTRPRARRGDARPRGGGKPARPRGTDDLAGARPGPGTPPSPRGLGAAAQLRRRRVRPRRWGRRAVGDAPAARTRATGREPARGLPAIPRVGCGGGPGLLGSPVHRRQPGPVSLCPGDAGAL